MFSNLGTTELLVIALVLIFLFGGKKLPELARGLGQSGRELKKAKKELKEAMDDIENDNETYQNEKQPNEKNRAKGGDKN